MKHLVNQGLVRFLNVILAVLVFSSAANASPHRIAVLDFRNPAGLSGQEVQYLSTVVRAASLTLPAERYLVLTRENIFQMLPPGADYATCTEAKCEVEFGRRVGADLVVSGDIVRFGRDLKVTIVLHATDTAALQATESASAPSVEALEQPVRAAAERIFASLGGARGAGRGRVFGGGLDLEPIPESWVDPESGPSVQISSLAGVDIDLLKKISFAKETERRGDATVHEKISAWQIVAEHPGNHPEKVQAEARVKEWVATIESAKKRRVQAARVFEQYQADAAKLGELLRLPEHTVSAAQKRSLSKSFEETYGPFFDDFKRLQREQEEADGANEFGL